jgi:hypothetical protein
VLYTGSFTPRILYPAASTRYLKVAWQPSTSQAGIAGYRLKRGVNNGTPAPIGGLVAAGWYADMSPPDGILQFEISAVDGLMQEGMPGFGSTTWESNPPAVPSAPLGLAWTRGLASVYGPAYWEMDEGTGHALTDGTGFGHTGRFGDPGDGDSAEPTWVNTIGGKALLFDGNDDYVEIADATDLRFQNASFTIEAWIKRAGLGGTQAILVKDASSSTRNYGLMLTSSNTIEFSFNRTSSSSLRRVISTATITDANWHHLAATYDDPNEIATIYLDGVPVASANLTGTMYVGSQPLLIGARTGGSPQSFFDGEIDLVRISTGMRYTGTFTPPEFYMGGPKRPTVILSWGLPATGLVNQYRVFRRLLPSGSDTQIAQVPAGQTTITDATVLAEQSYRYTVRALNSNNAQGPASAPLDVTPTATDAGPPSARGPRLRVEPNPFNPQALVRFRLDADGPVRLELYDVRGRKVSTLAQGNLRAGDHTVPITRADRDGKLSSGVYFVRLNADGRETRIKAVLIK